MDILRLSHTLTWLALCFALFPNTSAQARTKKVDIHVYPGYCAGTRCVIKGRIVRKSRFIKGIAKQGRLGSMMAMIRRFTRKYVPYASVRVSFQNKQKVVLADKKGYFYATFAQPTQLPPSSRPATRTSQPTTPSKHTLGYRTYQMMPDKALKKWGVLPVVAELAWPKKQKLQGTPTHGFMLQGSDLPGISIISDIDDTLIETFVYKKSKMLRKLLLSNPSQVRIFPRALDALRQLHKGPTTLHYLSGSPVQLLDRMLAIFQHHNFPVGSLNMKRLSGQEKHSLLHQTKYKADAIRKIFQAYPKHRFVLVGDSGEKDPEIYAAIRRLYPKQVLAIYIHNVTKADAKQKRFRGIRLFTHYKELLSSSSRPSQ